MLEVRVPKDTIRVVEDSRVTIYASDSEGNETFHVEIVCGGEDSPEGLIIDVYDANGESLIQTIALPFPQEVE
jgi:hypothetical protein